MPRIDCFNQCLASVAEGKLYQLVQHQSLSCFALLGSAGAVGINKVAQNFAVSANDAGGWQGYFETVVGELPSGRDPQVLAKIIMVNIWGLRVLAKTRADETPVRQRPGQLLAHLDEPG